MFCETSCFCANHGLVKTTFVQKAKFVENLALGGNLGFWKTYLWRKTRLFEKTSFLENQAIWNIKFLEMFVFFENQG